jgi:hypothetical protein
MAAKGRPTHRPAGLVCAGAAVAAWGVYLFVRLAGAADDQPHRDLNWTGSESALLYLAATVTVGLSLDGRACEGSRARFNTADAASPSHLAPRPLLSRAHSPSKGLTPQCPSAVVQEWPPGASWSSLATVWPVVATISPAADSPGCAPPGRIALRAGASRRVADRNAPKRLRRIASCGERLLARV